MENIPTLDQELQPKVQDLQPPVEWQGSYSSIDDHQTYIKDAEGKSRVLTHEKYAQQFLQESAPTSPTEVIPRHRSRRPGEIGSVKTPSYTAETGHRESKIPIRNERTPYDRVRERRSNNEEYRGIDGQPITGGNALKKEIKLLIERSDTARFDRATKALYKAAVKEATRRGGDDELLANVQAFIAESAAEIYRRKYSLFEDDSFSDFEPIVDTEPDGIGVDNPVPDGDDNPDDGGNPDDEDDLDIEPPTPLTDEEIARDAAAADERLQEALDRVKLSPELEGRLKDARNQFIALTTQRRLTSFGHKRKLAEAKEAYDRVRNESGIYVIKKMKELGAQERHIKAFAKQGALLEKDLLADAIAKSFAKDADKGKAFRGFYDWWARQGGKGNHWGKAKKAVAIGAIGFVPGVGAGIAAAAILGPVFGGALGGMVGKRLAGSLLSKKINRRANARTIGQEQAERFRSQAGNVIDGTNGKFSSEFLSGILQSQTEDINIRNKNRTVLSAAVGAVSGVAGAAVGDMIGDQAWPGRHRSSVSAETVAPRAPRGAASGGDGTPWTGEGQNGSGQTPNEQLGGGAGGAPADVVPVEVLPVPPGQYDYPFDWANEGLKSNDPMGLLHDLGEKAAADGHVIEWHNIGDGNNLNDWIEVDGRSDTDYVINILNRYRQELEEASV